MTRRTIDALVLEVYATHSSGRTYGRELQNYKPTRVTVWAKTDKRHAVWLDTYQGVEMLGHERTETKENDAAERYKRYVGQKITYTLKDNRIGFIRSKYFGA